MSGIGVYDAKGALIDALIALTVAAQPLENVQVSRQPRAVFA